MSASAILAAPQRLWIVTGKGGTGKTTLAAALGALAARTGQRTLVVSAGGDGALASLLDLPASAAEGAEPHEVAPGLSALCIRPEASLAEYLHLQLPLGGLAERLLRNRAFASFLDAAPGWRDLVALGKIWHMEQQRESGVVRWDRILVDAPATGHGLSLLSTPQVVLDTIKVGPLRRQAAAIRALLVDPRQTQAVVVTLAEELPVRETLELCARLAQVGVQRGPVLVNRIEPALNFTALRAALERVPSRGGPPLVRARPLRAALEFRARRHAQQARWIGELATGLEADPLTVPELADPLEGWIGVRRLADALEPTREQASA
jgi:anion-transporting  ArsA/GET3 family ATPase